MADPVEESSGAKGPAAPSRSPAKSAATLEELAIMRHALAADHHSSPGFRNYYAAEPEDERLPAMEAKGLVKRGRDIPGGLVYYHVTDRWKKALLPPYMHDPPCVGCGAKADERCTPECEAQ